MKLSYEATFYGEMTTNEYAILWKNEIFWNAKIYVEIKYYELWYSYMCDIILLHFRFQFITNGYKPSNSRQNLTSEINIMKSRYLLWTYKYKDR